MCKFASYNTEGRIICEETHTYCAFQRFCRKVNQWIETEAAKECKVMRNKEIPKGAYKVVDMRRGNLYVLVGDTIILLSNPYETIPDYVYLTKTKEGKYRIKKNNV